LDMAYKFSEVQVKCIASQLLSVLEFMHSRNFVHRDLKVCYYIIIIIIICCCFFLGGI
jgi:serine/threonine protein kinase